MNVCSIRILESLEFYDPLLDEVQILLRSKFFFIPIKELRYLKNHLFRVYDFHVSVNQGKETI